MHEGATQVCWSSASFEKPVAWRPEVFAPVSTEPLICRNNQQLPGCIPKTLSLCFLDVQTVARTCGANFHTSASVSRGLRALMVLASNTADPGSSSWNSRSDTLGIFAFDLHQLWDKLTCKGKQLPLFTVRSAGSQGGIANVGLKHHQSCDLKRYLRDSAWKFGKTKPCGTQPGLISRCAWKDIAVSTNSGSFSGRPYNNHVNKNDRDKKTNSNNESRAQIFGKSHDFQRTLGSLSTHCGFFKVSMPHSAHRCEARKALAIKAC